MCPRQVCAPPWASSRSLGLGLKLGGRWAVRRRGPECARPDGRQRETGGLCKLELLLPSKCTHIFKKFKARLLKNTWVGQREYCPRTTGLQPQTLFIFPSSNPIIFVEGKFAPMGSFAVSRGIFLLLSQFGVWWGVAGILLASTM